MLFLLQYTLWWWCKTHRIAAILRQSKFYFCMQQLSYNIGDGRTAIFKVYYLAAGCIASVIHVYCCASTSSSSSCMTIYKGHLQPVATSQWRPTPRGKRARQINWKSWKARIAASCMLACIQSVSQSTHKTNIHLLARGYVFVSAEHVFCLCRWQTTTSWRRLIYSVPSSSVGSLVRGCFARASAQGAMHRRRRGEGRLFVDRRQTTRLRLTDVLINSRVSEASVLLLKCSSTHASVINRQSLPARITSHRTSPVSEAAGRYRRRPTDLTAWRLYIRVVHGPVTCQLIL